MKFYAITRKYEQDVWYDLDKYEDSYDLKPTCFLPTFEMTEQYICDYLSMQYEVVEIELETLEKNGNWSWSIQI